MKNMKGILIKKIIVGTAEFNKLLNDLIDPSKAVKELNNLFVIWPDQKCNFTISTEILTFLSLLHVLSIKILDWDYRFKEKYNFNF